MRFTNDQPSVRGGIEGDLANGNFASDGQITYHGGFIEEVNISLLNCDLIKI